MQGTALLLNILANILKQSRETSEINFIIYFILSNLSKILSFQHFINVNINEIFSHFFCAKSSKNGIILHLHLNSYAKISLEILDLFYSI